jgi:hypothetical protein
VYKSLGSTQCYGGGTTVIALSQQLSNANIYVLSSTCGQDGLGHPAVCGASDGAIGIFDIPVAQQADALNLQFSLLSTLPSATVVACN